VAAATLAFAAALLAPLYLRAAGDSVVRSAITAAPAYSSGVTLGSGVNLVTAAQIAAAEQQLAGSSAGRHWYRDPITAVSTGIHVTGLEPTAFPSTFYYESGICAHLIMRSGTCDLGPDTVLVSDRSAPLLNVSTGARLEVSFHGDIPPRAYSVAGIYAVPDLQAPYWWGNGPGIFDYGAIATTGPSPLDSLIVSMSTALAVPPQALPSVSGEVALRAGRVNLASEGSLLRYMAVAKNEVAQRDGVVLASDAPSLLAGAAHDRHIMSTIVVTVAVQLLVLALWVLTSLVVRSSEARQSEIRLARLRGFPWTSVLSVIAAEPAALCGAGLPIGALLAWVTVRVTSSQLFAPQTSVRTDGWLWVSVGSSLAGVAVALGVGAIRVYRATALAEPALGGMSRRRLAAAWRTRAGAIGDLAILTVSVAALVELASSGAFAGGRTDPLSAAGPGLVALGVAVVGVQLILLTARGLSALTVGSKRVGLFLAVRQTARRPVLVRQARVLVVALCLACFASAAWSIARTNRSELATFQVGASMVADVVPPAGVAPQGLVDEVDPTGRYSMAAAVVSTSSSTLLAVDPSRLVGVAAWPPGVSAASLRQVAAALSPPTAPEVVLTGSAISVRATASGAATAPGAGQIDLEAQVYNLAVGSAALVDLGPLVSGSTSYTGTLGVDCVTACRFDGLSLVPTDSTASSVLTSGDTTLTITGVRVQGQSGQWAPLGADLSPDGWTASEPGVQVRTGRAGPSISVSAAALEAFAGGAKPQAGPMAGPASAPAVLPAVVTTTVKEVNGAGLPGTSIPTQGLDGNTLTVAPTFLAATLPEVGANAVLVNLDLVQDAEISSTSTDAVFQVWLAPGAPRDVLAKLDRVGLRVTSVQRASDVLSQLDKSGPALADTFLLLSTVAALLVVVLSTLATLAATTRQRASELAFLEVAGVRRRSLVRSLLGESGALAVTTLFGLAAGIVATALVVPSLPELASTSAAAPPLQYPLPLPLLAAVSACVVFTVLVSGLVINTAVLRRSAAQLRRVGLR